MHKVIVYVCYITISTTYYLYDDYLVDNFSATTSFPVAVASFTSSNDSSNSSQSLNHWKRRDDRLLLTSSWGNCSSPPCPSSFSVYVVSIHLYRQIKEHKMVRTPRSRLFYISTPSTSASATNHHNDFFPSAYFSSSLPFYRPPLSRGFSFFQRLSATSFPLLLRSSPSSPLTRAACSRPPPAISAAVRTGGGASYETAGGGGGDRQSAGPPPDLPSLLLSERIVYLGLPLVPKVTELIIAQLLYLEYESADKPITMYINSKGGSVSREGGMDAMDTEALAIADVMNYVKPVVHTVCVGQAHGTAAMLLANGAKGKRCALPNASILLKQPSGKVPQSQAADIAGMAEEMLFTCNKVVKLIGQACGRSFDFVLKDVQRNKYLAPQEAVEYGLIDRVLTPSTTMSPSHGRASAATT